MWWRKDEPSSENSKRSNKASSTRNLRKQLIGRHQPTAADTSNHSNNEEPMLHVLHDDSGIEVSFSDELISSPEDIRTPRLEEGVVSLKAQLGRCQRIHRAQFRPTKPRPETAREPSLRGFQLRKHRVPLFGLAAAPQKAEDVLFLLRSHDVVDEIACVQEELTHLTTEIAALEEDRADLLAKAISFQASSNDDAHSQQVQDVHRQLAKHTLSHKERTQLQEQRGLFLTVALHNKQAKEAFLSKCGVTTSLFRQQKKSNWKNDTVVTLGPDNCRDGGAGATIQHVALLKGTETAFFMAKDKGKAFCWGYLPERLFRRMKNEGYDPTHHASDIIYMATGPMGSYYAEFRNGECWWGTCSDDEQFHAICSEKSWQIYRVAFGPCTVFHDGNGYQHHVTSWIILGRDGRVVWKNIPARLQSKLESRLADAPACCEVALGSGGSYFVRFIDGSMDYCLPAAAAEVCHTLDCHGSSIMSISLHPELSHDFIIRHTR